MKTILLTGAAGFIGSHVADLLVGRGDRVVGLDALTDYYDVSLKTDRHAKVKFPWRRRKWGSSKARPQDTTRARSPPRSLTA